MYIPPSNAEPSAPAVHDFIDVHPLGVLVTASADGLFATHLPLLLHRDRGAHGTLAGHVARANPHHRQVPSIAEALVIFSGPQAYITPTWYAAKEEHGKVVPTWNYIAVHVYGSLRFTDDPVFLRKHLEQLVSRHEAGRPVSWGIGDAPERYIEQQVKAIVGLELTITRLEGKWKMSQNRSDADIDGVVRGLQQSTADNDRVVAGIVEARRPR